MLVGTLLVAGLVYAQYDEVNDRLNRRRAAISRQFPNVVSKLALLVTSGMIMDRPGGRPPRARIWSCIRRCGLPPRS